MRKNHFLRAFQRLSSLHEGLALLKDLPNPWRQNRTCMRGKIILKGHREIYGSNASWIYMGFSAIERLT